MNSFLEKLQKGMGAVPQAAVDGMPETEIPPETPEPESPPETAAVFAAYKTPARQKKRGIPTLEDNDAATPTPAPESGKKIITAQNIGQIKESKNLSQSKPAVEKKSGKKPGKTRKTNMANKKNPVQSWLNPDEAQLAVNLYQTETELVLQTALAGVRVEDLDVLIEDETINIKGQRPNPMPESGDYFVEECYFGPFSRKIILPAEVDSGRADALMKDGILTIRIPKIIHEKKKKITIKA